MKKHNLFLASLSAISALLLFTSCEKDALYRSDVKMNDAHWHLDSIYPFVLNVTDTVPYYYFYLNFRNDETYPYANIISEIETTLPNGKLRKDTVEAYIQNPATGAYLGKSSSGVYFNPIIYQKRKFPNTGEYTFKIRHLMRDTLLNGVYNVGMKISEYKD